MVKYHLIQLSICLLYLNIIPGHRIERDLVQGFDELDRSLAIDKSGCKILTLEKGKSAQFSTHSQDLNNIVLLKNTTYKTNVETFQMHFGIRSDGDVELFLFSRNQYNKSQTEPDFKFNFGNNFVKTTVTSFRDDTHRQKYTPKLISNDKYAKFFINLDQRRLFYGQECDPFPIFSLVNLFDYHAGVEQFGFTAKSENGARILYDCPLSFAGCKCT